MTQRVLQPAQFWKLRGTDDGLKGAKIEHVADVLYGREPEFMGRLEADVRERGVTSPVGLRANQYGHLEIHGGMHRAAAAYRAGVPLPRADRDESEADPAWQRSKAEQHARDTLGDR